MLIDEMSAPSGCAWERVSHLVHSCGAPVDLAERDHPHRRPLALAARLGSARVVELLLDAGADANTTDADGATALHLAASGGHAAVCERLLVRGAERTRKDRAGLDPFARARLGASEDHVEVVALLKAARRSAAGARRASLAAAEQAGDRRRALQAASKAARCAVKSGGSSATSSRFTKATIRPPLRALLSQDDNGVGGGGGGGGGDRRRVGACKSAEYERPMRDAAADYGLKRASMDCVLTSRWRGGELTVRRDRAF